MRSYLLGFLLGISLPFTGMNAFQQNFSLKNRTVELIQRLFNQLIDHFDLILLAPFNQLRLEIDLLAGYFAQIDILADDTVLHEIHAIVISSVQIDGTNQGFKCIASHVTVVSGMAGSEFDEFGQTNLFGHLIQGLARNNLGTGIGQETFTLPIELLIDNITYHRTQYGITQELQALVVEQPSIIQLYRGGLMEQRLFIITDIVRIEPQHPIKTKIRLPVLSEKKSYLVYKIAKCLIQHISSRLHMHYVHRNRMCCSMLHELRASEPC